MHVHVLSSDGPIWPRARGIVLHSRRGRRTSDTHVRGGNKRAMPLALVLSMPAKFTLALKTIYMHVLRPMAGRYAGIVLLGLPRDWDACGSWRVGSYLRSSPRKASNAAGTDAAAVPLVPQGQLATSRHPPERYPPWGVGISANYDRGQADV